MTVSDRTKTNKYLKEYRKCKVNTCSNRVFNGGVMCSTHRYRFKTHGTYDLPGHIGEPSILEVEERPDWAYGKCQNCGWLREEQMYKSLTCNGKYKTKGCRKCAIDRNIKRNYKMKGGIEEYNKLREAQDNKCAICNQENTMTRNGSEEFRQLSIDHCHASGKFRGLLCGHCNSGLGYFKDSIEILEAAIKYLKKHREEQFL